ncbi:hypothetical protein F0L68_25025 [Solihabitans fulvus]|uniref:OmpR/PhoB-type domain-containing protein n=1 Tax=Solihabitans fulvus TaxID=1892852 RepID=A0A5B2X339_9PSEU|nr:hypothetical protein F0L68_25025 [Solihabitans fulvus]
MLAGLLLEAGQVVTVRRLVDLLWGSTPPRSARTAVHVYVSGLRRALAELPEATLVTCGQGYQLDVDPQLVDLHLFRQLVAEARSVDDDTRASELLRGALDLWHGPALVGAPASPVLDRIRSGLADERLAAIEERIHLDLRLGRHSYALSKLVELAAEHPLREQLAGMLMLALYRCGRQAEALEVFRKIHRRLVDELGIGPGPELESLHQQILDTDVALAAGPEPGVATQQPVSIVPRQLPGGLGRIVGRDRELAALDALFDRRDRAKQAAVPISVISGMAGVGKTALAVYFGHRVVDRCPDGQLYLDLRGFDSSGAPLHPSEALGQFLRALGVPAGQIPVELPERAAMYRSLVAGRQLLIVLDNAATGEQVRPLLPGTPGSVVLVTSRNRLDGLVAHEDAHQLPLDTLTPSASAELLACVLGARRAEEEPRALAELARLCGQLPLALRMVAANLAARPGGRISDVVGRMTDGNQLAALGALDEEKPVVRAAFDGSYRGLRLEARQLFRRLGLLPGPEFSADAAAKLAGGTVAQAVRQLDQLANAHLVEHVGRDRFRLHELLHRYALERVRIEDSQPDRESAVRRLVGWYLHTAKAALAFLSPEFLRLPKPRTGDSPPKAVFTRGADATAWLDVERANLLAARDLAARCGPDTVAGEFADVLAGLFRPDRRLAGWCPTTAVQV